MNDALAEELDQLEKLARLKAAYGWEEDDPAYVKALNNIKKAGINARKGAVVNCKQEGGGNGWQPKKPPPDEWSFVGSMKASGFPQAKKLLDKVQAGGNWVSYRHCPSTKAEGKLPVKRYITDCNGIWHARLVDLKDGNFRCDIPIWKDQEEEEEAEEEPPADQVDEAQPASAKTKPPPARAEKGGKKRKPEAAATDPKAAADPAPEPRVRRKSARA